MARLPTNGKTGWWVAGIMAVLFTGSVVRQIEWGSVAKDLGHHTNLGAHELADKRLRALEDSELITKHWRINVETQLRSIASKVGAEVTLP